MEIYSPTNLISKWAGIITKSKFSKMFIPLYMQAYGIKESRIEKPLKEYKSLNDFFTRKLKPNTRKIDGNPNSIISPVDGVVAQKGKIENGTLIQAKGIDYSIKDLIPCKDASVYEGGMYLTVYLSPKDYHRIHSPFTGKLEGYEYVPGKLFPVNQLGVRNVKGLFAKNERVTTFFQLENGQAALVKVGAFIVGSVQLSYEENLYAQYRGTYQAKHFSNHNIYAQKGEELGWFEFGSTIILILDKETGLFLDEINAGTVLEMGMPVGTLFV